MAAGGGGGGWKCGGDGGDDKCRRGEVEGVGVAMGGEVVGDGMDEKAACWICMICI